MKPICSAWADIYFSMGICVRDFSPRIIQKVVIQGRPAQQHWANWAGWSQFFSLLWTFHSSDDVLPNQQDWSWKQQLNWSRFRGQRSFLPIWKDLQNGLFVTIGHQNCCNEQRSATMIQFWCRAHSGPYGKETRLSALKALLKRLCCKRLDFQGLEAEAWS